MKLRNKKTGEIRPAETREDGIYLYDEITEQWYKYELDLLAGCWEYYEEPKGVWYMDWKGDIRIANADEDWSSEKSIGNYFKTKEEAEKAVEKLKALKRLKNNGFKFSGWTIESGSESICNVEGDICIFATLENYSHREDLDLLFGGE